MRRTWLPGGLTTPSAATPEPLSPFPITGVLLMPCHHLARVRVYKRGPAPSYPFLPFGEVCKKCHRHLEPSTNEGGGR